MRSETDGSPAVTGAPQYVTDGVGRNGRAHPGRDAFGVDTCDRRGRHRSCRVRRPRQLHRRCGLRRAHRRDPRARNRTLASSLRGGVSAAPPSSRAGGPSAVLRVRALPGTADIRRRYRWRGPPRARDLRDRSPYSRPPHGRIPGHPPCVARRSTRHSPRRVLRPRRSPDPARAATTHPDHRRRSLRRRAAPRRPPRRRLDRHLELRATVRASERHDRRRRRGGRPTERRMAARNAGLVRHRKRSCRPDARHSLRRWKACTTSRSNDSSATARAVPPRPSPSSWRRTSWPGAARSTCWRVPRTWTRRWPASPRSAASSTTSLHLAADPR